MPPQDDLRYPTLDGLRAFEAAARLGSFERAADELAITASAVGKRVSAVEELIGAELLLRGGKLLQLSAAGRDYLAQIRPVLTLMAAVPQHRRRRQRQRRLRISAPPTFARQLLVPALGGFAEARPDLAADVELEVVLSVPFLQLLPGDAELEVLHEDPRLPGATLLMHEQVTPLAAPALRARLPERPAPADLARLPLLRTPIEPWAPWFRAAGLPWPEPEAGPSLVDLGMTLEAAVAGQGVALGRPSLALAWLASGALVPLVDLAAEPPRQYVARHADEPVAAALAGWLQAHCGAVAQQAQALLSGRA